MLIELTRTDTRIRDRIDSLTFQSAEEVTQVRQHVNLLLTLPRGRLGPVLVVGLRSFGVDRQDQLRPVFVPHHNRCVDGEGGPGL